MKSSGLFKSKSFLNSFVGVFLWAGFKEEVASEGTREGDKSAGEGAGAFSDLDGVATFEGVVIRFEAAVLEGVFEGVVRFLISPSTLRAGRLGSTGVFNASDEVC